MDKLKSKIIEMVNSTGYDYAVNIGFWNDYEVYEPIYWADGIYNEGLPEFILAKDEEIRWTNSSEEAFKVINEMEKYETNELENEPIKLEPNLTMKSFKFECGGYMGCDIFEYKSLKKGNFLTYNENGCGSLDIKPSKIKIEDDTTFCLRRNNKLKSELESTSQRDNCPRISTSKEKQEEKISLAF